MSRENERALSQEIAGFDDGCEPAICPNPDCNQIFFDLDEDFWEHGNSDVECRKCKQPVKHVGSINSKKRPSKSIYIYKCVPCKIKFTRRIPAMKRRCPNCKEEFFMFWNLLLGLPGHSANRPCRKALLQSA